MKKHPKIIRWEQSDVPEMCVGRNHSCNNVATTAARMSNGGLYPLCDHCAKEAKDVQSKPAATGEKQ